MNARWRRSSARCRSTAWATRAPVRTVSIRSMRRSTCRWSGTRWRCAVGWRRRRRRGRSTKRCWICPAVLGRRCRSVRRNSWRLARRRTSTRSTRRGVRRQASRRRTSRWSCSPSTARGWCSASITLAAQRQLFWPVSGSSWVYVPTTTLIPVDGVGGAPRRPKRGGKRDPMQPFGFDARAFSTPLAPSTGARTRTRPGVHEVDRRRARGNSGPGARPRGAGAGGAFRRERSVR